MSDINENIKVLADRQDIVAIANAVRTKTGNANEMTISEMISGINGIEAKPVLQDKTVTPTTSKQTVSADSGYDGLNQVTVNAMPTATQATPSITVNSSGLITATATQSAGYVSAGTKTGTKQLAFQAAKTVTPTTTDQVAIAANTYAGGAVTVKGDSDLLAGNIKKGIDIFGVAGSYEGSGGSGGGTGIETCTVTIHSTVQAVSGDYVSSIAYTSIESGMLKTEYAEAYGDKYEAGHGTGSRPSKYVIECAVGTDIMLYDDNFIGWTAITTSSNATINNNIPTFAHHAVTINSGPYATIWVEL